MGFRTFYFYKKMYKSLPAVAEWSYKEFEIVGDILNELGEPMKEVVEIYYRNPVELVRELLGNPDFKDEIHYKPFRMYTDASGTERIFGEMFTAEWWWEVAVCG